MFAIIHRNRFLRNGLNRCFEVLPRNPDLLPFCSPFLKGDTAKPRGILTPLSQATFPLERGKQIRNIIHIYIPFFVMNVSLNYNWNLNKFARFNRNQMNMPKAEWLMRNLVLKNKQMLWYRFIRQKIFWNYILDFYCAKLKLCIEVDDQSHDRKWDDDKERTKYLNSLWINVIRYTNEQIYYNLDWVIQDLEWIVKDIENHKQISYCD